MNQLLLVRLIPTMCSAMLCGCTTMPAPGSNGNGNNNGNTNINTNNNSSGSSKFTLSVSVNNAEGPSRGPDVRVFVSDQPYTDRLDPPYDGPLQMASLRGGDEYGLTSTDIQVDAGMAVTIVALESKGGTTTIAEGGDASGMQSIDNAEFVNFVPDSMGGVTITDEGVIYFTMDRDISVEANFRQMPSLRVNHVGDQVIAYGFYDRVEVIAPKWLTLPEADLDFTTGNSVLACPIGINGGTDLDNPISRRVFLAQAKTGTEIEITVDDLEGSGFTFDNWSGTSNNCGGNRTCTLVLGADSDITATWTN